MKLTALDAEDALLDGRSRVEDWKAEFVRNWFKPYTDMALVMFWDRQSPEVKAQLKRMNAAAYQEVDDQVEKIKRGGMNGAK